MVRHGIPTAAHATFTDAAPAHAYIDRQGAPIVIKADGLAAGKGVVVATTVEEARAAATDMLSGNSLGSAGSRVVVEDFLDGEEASFIIIAAGGRCVELATSQDHKRVGDGDTGPNTGGMGAYSPAPVVTGAVHARVLRDVIEPTLAGLKADGTDFTGFLYAGLMISSRGEPRVLEFNCRLGDPETQPLMMRLASDLTVILEAAIDQKLETVKAQWDPRPALGVVLAAQGYPGAYRKRDEIFGLDAAAGTDFKVFHAGTTVDPPSRKVITAGGRVLCACALGDDIAAAQKRAYQGAAKIRWEGMQFRRDIGYRAIGRK
jgi:phosphoribosylamine--glycine ligase